MVSSSALPADPDELMERLRAAGGRLCAPQLCVRLAEAHGFCQGVRHAVTRAHRAAGEETSSRLFISGELIHNPAINAQLQAEGVRALPPPGTPDRLADVRRQDRVIIPAFGIEREFEDRLREIGCELIDTTCGWVRKVWHAVADFSAAGLTVVIHGKVEHEETRATASRISGPYVTVRDRPQALALAAVVEGSPEPPPFARQFARSCSAAFDPERDLARLGLVNQTTMLSSETEEIAGILRTALRKRLGREPRADEFRTLDTFCPATQERQDAVRGLLGDGDVALVIVVGGFRSSNTAHLARLAGREVPTYHVEDASCLISADEIRHLPPGAAGPITARNWLPPQRCKIGLCAGASTPDAETGRIVARLLVIHRERDPQPTTAQEGIER